MTVGLFLSGIGALLSATGVGIILYSLKNKPNLQESFDRASQEEKFRQF